MSRRQSLHRQQVIKEGFLSRAPAGKLSALKSWERSWYVFGLQALSPYLECYTDPQGVLTGLALERIELDSCQQIVTKMITVDSRHPHSFNLILSDRVLCLAADTRNELSAWCRALQTKLEELGVLTPMHENVYEMQQPLSRLRQVSLQDQSASDRPSLAHAATAASAAAPGVRRPRAATPLSSASSDSGAPDASPRPAARLSGGTRVENDFAPPRRPVVCDSEEARRNVGRLLAVCTAQDGYEGGGCSCGSCNGCSDCSCPSVAFNRQAGTAAAVVPVAESRSGDRAALPATVATVPPAAAPRRSQAAHAATAANVSCSTAAQVTTNASTLAAAESQFSSLRCDDTYQTSAAQAACEPVLLDSPAAPEASFRPIDAAPAPVDRWSSRTVQPMARPVAVSGAAGPFVPVVAARMPSVSAADYTGIRHVQQQSQILPQRGADRACLNCSPERVLERSENDFCARRPLPPVAASDNNSRPIADRTSLLATPRLSVQQTVPAEQQQCKTTTSGESPAAFRADATVRLNGDSSEATPSTVVRRSRPIAKADAVNGAAGDYAMVVGRTLVATEGSDDGCALYSVATTKTCLFGLDLEGGGGGGAAAVLVENDYELPLSAAAEHSQEASHFSSTPVGVDRVRAAALTVAPNSSAAAASSVAAMSRPRDSPGELQSSDRRKEAKEVSSKVIPCDDVTGRGQRQQSVKRLVNTDALLVLDSDDDSEGSYVEAVLPPPFSSIMSSVAPDAAIDRYDLHVPPTGRLAHGQSSYSEAVAADNPVDEALLGLETECPPLPAKLAGRPLASTAKPVHETARVDRPAAAGSVAKSTAAAATAAAGCKKVISSGLIAESMEYQDWPPHGRSDAAEVKPPLPQRLRGSSAGRSAKAVHQWLQKASGSAASARDRDSNVGESSSSDSEANTTAAAAPVRPPRIAPRSGGTLVFGGGMLKMPRQRPSAAARDGEAFGQLPIRQSQVEDLLREVNNVGGVKVSAYKKEVSGNICFVDVDNRVWIAGWNQKNQPLLQKLLHVGDEVLSLNHEPITSSSMLYKNIRMGDNDRKLSFVLRRLPLATVLSLRKSYDGEDVGIRCQSGTPEVDVVVPGGLAHISGLKPRASSLDSSRQCNWFISEINNRPISLLSKSGEVEPRLTAVGKDVMLVLQPVDFITKLKKQLKGQWGYKNYIVQ